MPAAIIAKYEAISVYLLIHQQVVLQRHNAFPSLVYQNEAFFFVFLVCVYLGALRDKIYFRFQNVDIKFSYTLALKFLWQRYGGYFG